METSVKSCASICDLTLRSSGVWVRVRVRVGVRVKGQGQG